MELEHTTVSKSSKRTMSRDLTLYIVIGVVTLIIGGGIGFFGGIQFQKTQVTSLASNPLRGTTSPQGFGGTIAHMGGIGTVTAITNNSITISPRLRRGGSVTDMTYAITGTTTVTDNGASSTVNAIAVGDLVRIQTSPSADTTATSIDLVSTAQNSTGGNSNGSNTPSVSD